MEGYSVHANTFIHANGKKGLEHLARYAGRNAIALNRLERRPNDRVAYRFKHPMAHLTRYHGVLAPNARLRPKVVLVPRPKQRLEEKPAAPAPLRRLDWAGLLKRVFAIDVLQCPKCDGRLKVLAYLTERVVVKRILTHLGLPTELLPQPPSPASETLLEISPLTEASLNEAIEVERRIAKLGSAPAEVEGASAWELEVDSRRGFTDQDFIQPELWTERPGNEIRGSGEDAISPVTPGARQRGIGALNPRSRPDAGGEDGSREGGELGGGASGGVTERAQGPPGGVERQAGADAAEREELDGERSEG